MLSEEEAREHQCIEIGVQVFLVRDNNILLGKRGRGFGRGTWGLPGGHLKFGEEFEEAGLRELCEETSLKGREAKVITIANTPFPTGVHHIQIGILVKNGQGEPQIVEPDKCAEWRFFSLDELPSDEEIYTPSLPLIKNFLAHRFYNQE